MMPAWRGHLEPVPGYFLAASRAQAALDHDDAGRFEGAGAVLFGVPLDSTTTFRAGARGGPAAIREMSWSLEDHSLWQQRFLPETAYADLGDVRVSTGDVAGTLRRVAAVAGGLHDAGKLPFVLGGEHLITLPLVEAAAARHPGLAVVQFDAHADLRDHYDGDRLSHATVMRRCAEVVGPDQLWQFGIRSGLPEELDYATAHTRLHQFEVLEPLQAALPGLAGRPLYVTVDVDVCDPAFAPGTGTPEPGGVSSRELLQALLLLRGHRVVGLDIVEVSPAFDPAGVTAMLAAWLMRESLRAFLP